MDDRPYVHIPETVSPQAQEFLERSGIPLSTPRFPTPPTSLDGRSCRHGQRPTVKPNPIPCSSATSTPSRRGSLAVFVCWTCVPKGWEDNGKALVYTHGGAHVMYSAASMLGRAVVAAHTTPGAPGDLRRPRRPAPSRSRSRNRAPRRAPPRSPLHGRETRIGSDETAHHEQWQPRERIGYGHADRRAGHPREQQRDRKDEDRAPHMRSEHRGGTRTGGYTDLLGRPLTR